VTTGRAFTLSLAALLGACAATPRPAEEPAPVAAFDWFDYAGSDPLPEPGPGEFRNPVLQGFYPDPSITRVGDDYYLVNSTFAWFPGIPIFHSRDLVSWTQIGNAIDRPGQLDFAKLGLSRGVFAPDISFHDGTFYILNTCVDCGGNFVITAADPKGPWSDPVWLPEIVGGIDPSLFFDEDGSAWILNNGPPEGTPRYDGHRAIWIQRFDPKAMKMVGPRKVLIDGGIDPAAKPIWIEGPHIFRKNGFYYLTAAEGGTAEGHSQVILRSRSVTGPYEIGPHNPILTQRDLPRDRPNPITSAGHADLVETAAGEWWASFLAVRPYGGDFYNTGRETFLLPVTWKDGWPQITQPGETIPVTHKRPALPAQAAPGVPMNGAFHLREEFEGAALPPSWMTMRNPRDRWYALANGKLRIEARPVGLGDFGNPSLLGRRQQHPDAAATTKIDFVPRRAGDEAGIVALQNDEYWFFLAVTTENGRRVVTLKRRAGSGDPTGGVAVASAPLPASGAVSLRIVARGGQYDFQYAGPDGRWQTLRAGEDGTILSTKTAGGFVGSVFALHARSAP
jgi:alpha-N-arabinofuranosidase